MKLIQLAPSLSMPIDMVTETSATLGRRGSGKTHTASVVAEEMLDARAQIIVLDPLDAWWGLRADREGKPSGYPIVVIGGSHGDLPLTAEAGTLLADFAVEQRVSMVLSMRHLSKNDQRRFATAFCERLYHRKGEPEYREALHLFIDEADAFAPQRVMADQARCMGAVDDLVRRGRSSGIGVSLITQRSASINKDVLSQVEILIAHQTVGPQDRKALDAWVEAHDAHDQRGAFMASLAELQKGEAWVWSPGWLNIFQRVKIRERKTFDSSATPKQGTKPVAVSLRKVDIEGLRSQLAAVIEKAEADDPKALRKRIAELEKFSRQREVVGNAVPVARFDELRAELSAAQQANAKLKKERLNWLKFLRRIGIEMRDNAVALLETVELNDDAERGEPKPWTPPARPKREPDIKTPDIRGDNGHSADPLPKGERAVLIAIAQQAEGVGRDQLSVLTGYKRRTRDAYIQRLRERQAIAIRDNQIVATAKGVASLGEDYMPLPTGDALLDHWRITLPEGERRVLDAVVAVYPGTVERSAIDEATGYQRRTRDTYLQRLQARRLVRKDGSAIVASDLLFGP